MLSNRIAANSSIVSLTGTVTSLICDKMACFETEQPLSRLLVKCAG